MELLAAGKSVPINGNLEFANELHILYDDLMIMETIALKAEETLKQAGLQKTAQRLAVLDILTRAEQPLTAGDVFERLPGEQKVNRVTVYRILSSYTRKGIIREFESKRGIHFYERAWPLIPLHPHFNCRLRYDDLYERLSFSRMVGTNSESARFRDRKYQYQRTLRVVPTKK